jgi:hypothetical protein
MYLQSHIYKNIPISFDFITTWNQGVFLCSPSIKPRTQMPTQVAEGFFELLIPHDKNLTLDYLFEIR